MNFLVKDFESYHMTNKQRDGRSHKYTPQSYSTARGTHKWQLMHKVIGLLVRRVLHISQRSTDSKRHPTCK